MIAQQLACSHPELVEKLILLGTGPRGGEGITFSELSAEEQSDPASFLLAAFFTSTADSRAAGKAFMDRMAGRQADRDSALKDSDCTAEGDKRMGSRTLIRSLFYLERHYPLSPRCPR
jgi:pimeloyl-ACP methyl ester carboxylesterase